VSTKEEENRKFMILFLAALYVVVAVTFTAVWSYQAKAQATKANSSAQAADNDAKQADSDIQSTDQDVQQTDQDVNNVCSAIGNLPDGSC